MLINLSNHPSTNWLPKQKNAARKYGNIIDITFPNVPPEYGMADIQEMAVCLLQDIIELREQYSEESVTVHLMGEQTLCFALLIRLKEAGISCLASATQRIAVEEGNIKKTIFNFVQFRSYW